ncbi:hypothetical protein B0T19DRAFT_41105 [Cercophora scortea]|uniref:Hepatocellular carcinoma-associated antigen 59-domain-containing protein n=1 Tax=Cercophora scortea TaxID=314031 RepID=A0AAE0J4M8_9PEZI|nr:hypothetical protein B0T19DRAFT_41105 [Cercophora scortea]
MSSPRPDTTSEPQVVFRPGKKRKIYRQRAEEETPASDEVPVATTPTAIAATARKPSSDNDDDDEGETGLSVTEALRLRNARKHRHGGVGFRAGPASHSDGNSGANARDENTEQGMVLHDGADGQRPEESAILGGITMRFAPQTGLVGELVNKNMEEYIESELARRKRLAAENRTGYDDQHPGGTAAKAAAGPGPSTFTGASASGVPAESQRVLHGKLLEIDLGDETRERNVTLTERARRRLLGHSVDDPNEDDDGNSRAGKVRVGPDGKPWRPKNRRGSDDIKRDQLVEEFLSENRLDIYDVSSEPPAVGADLEGDEAAADDRIAEEFRRQFMDAMSQRHRRRRPAVNAAPKPAAKTNPDEILRGPKLGGSRNARAAMRDKLLKEQEAKKRK